MTPARAARAAARVAAPAAAPARGGDTSGSGNAGAGAGGNAEGQADAAAARAAAASEAAQEQADAERKAAKEKAQAERDAAEAARKAAEAQRKAAERAAKAAAQAAAAAAKARETWDRRGRPKKLIIVRATSIDAITNGSLTKRTPRSGSVTLQALGRIVPNSFLTIDGDTANLNAAVVLTPQTTLDISGVKTLKLGGGDSPTEAAFLYTGSGRILVDGVTVTSANKDGQPLAMSSQGRPYIVVSSRGRFEATDSTLSDLGVQPTGTDKGDPGISYNTDSTGALVRTQLLRNTTGAELSKSKNIKLEGVTAAESWSDGLLLQGDIGTTLTDIKAERNGGNGVTVTGESSDREIHNITTSGNHSYGVAVVGQNKAAGHEHQRDRRRRGRAAGQPVHRLRGARRHHRRPADRAVHAREHHQRDAAEPADDRRTARDRRGEDHQGRDDQQLDDRRRPGRRDRDRRPRRHAGRRSVSDSRTGVRIERGAGNIVANALKLSGGQDGLVTTAGTTGVVIKDMTADGVENDAVRNFSPGAQIIGGHVNGGLTGIDAEAATTITGVGEPLQRGHPRPDLRARHGARRHRRRGDRRDERRRRHARRPDELAGARPRGGPRPAGAHRHGQRPEPARDQPAGRDRRSADHPGAGARGHALTAPAPLRRHEPAPAAVPAGDRLRNRNTMNATRTLTVRAATLVAAAGLLLSGCGSTAPNALVRRDVAPAATSDVSKPCTREAAATGAPAAESAPAGLAATFDAAGDKIVLSGGQNVTLPALSREAQQAGPAQGDRSRRVAAGQDHRDQPGRLAQDRGTDGPVAEAAERRRRVHLGEGARRRHRHQRHLHHLVERGQGHGRRGLPQRPRLPPGPRRRADDDRQGGAAVPRLR